MIIFINKVLYWMKLELEQVLWYTVLFLVDNESFKFNVVNIWSNEWYGAVGL